MRKVRVQLIGAAALLLSLAACGAKDDEPKPRVAALPGTTSATTPPAAGAAADNVRQLPLGATEEESDRAYRAYYACWEQHGVPSHPAPNGGGPLLTWKQNPKKYQPAVDACADKEPLNPPELDPAQNPDYADDMRAQKACMEGHGIQMEIRGTGKDASLWAVDTKANLAKANSDEGMQFYRECEISAFTKK